MIMSRDKNNQCGRKYRAQKSPKTDLISFSILIFDYFFRLGDLGIHPGQHRDLSHGLCYVVPMTFLLSPRHFHTQVTPLIPPLTRTISSKKAAYTVRFIRVKHRCGERCAICLCQYPGVRGSPMEG